MNYTPEERAGLLVADIEDQTLKTRDDVARQYAIALGSVPTSHPTFWRDVNTAIVMRWSRSSLEHVKVHAWRLAREGA